MGDGYPRCTEPLYSLTSYVVLEDYLRNLRIHYSDKLLFSLSIYRFVDLIYSHGSNNTRLFFGLADFVIIIIGVIILIVTIITIIVKFLIAVANTPSIQQAKT